MKEPVKIVVQFFFWTIGYFVLLGIFASSSEWLPIDFVYTTIFTLTLMIPVAINKFFLLPGFLLRSRYSSWFLLVNITVGLAILFNHFLFDKWIDVVLPGYYFISYYDLIDLAKFFVAFVGLDTLIDLSLQWLSEKEKIATLERQRIDAEFRALVNQVNPHFLFNGLTVLYTLSLKDSKETSSAIIKLSDILRYVIYQSPGDTVKLSSEANIIQDYIDLQRYRVHPTTQIDFIDETSDNVAVSPMLFLPLVENAFKHGVQGETESAFVCIALREDNGVVNFTISNNKSGIGNQAGIGLRNLKERLELLYPRRHKFEVSETENTFDVHLQISP